MSEKYDRAGQEKKIKEDAIRAFFPSSLLKFLLLFAVIIIR